MPARHYVGPTSRTPQKATCRPTGLVRLVSERWELVNCPICKGRLIGLVIERPTRTVGTITDVSSGSVTVRPELGPSLVVPYRQLDREWWVA